MEREWNEHESGEENDLATTCARPAEPAVAA